MTTTPSEWPEDQAERIEAKIDNLMDRLARLEAEWSLAKKVVTTILTLGLPALVSYLQGKFGNQ